MKSGSSAPVRLFPCLIVLTVFVLTAFASGPARAQASSPTPQPAPQIVDDRLHGEGDRHERREEWFFSSRRAGTTSDGEMARLRLEAVEDTRAAIEAQRARRATAGYQEESAGVWFSQGPSPSNFGSWSFGRVAGRVSSLDSDWLNGILYLGTAAGGLWKSADDGQSWTQIFDTAGTQTIGTVAVDPFNPGTVWVGTGENHRGCESYFGIGILRSTDGGASWEMRNGTGLTTLEGLASFADILIDPRDTDWIVTGGRISGCDVGSQTAGGIFVSDDAGLSWSERLANTEIYEIARDPAVFDVLWAATSRGIYKSTDNGLIWALQTASGLPNGSYIGRTELAIAPSDGNTVYALFSTGGNSFWRSTDGGATWSQRATGGSACDGQCWYNMVLRVHLSNPDIVYRGTVHLFKSTNGGTSWQDLSHNWGSSQTVHQDMHVLLMNPLSENSFYAGGDGGLWKTPNSGASFSNLNGNLNITQFYAVDVSAQDPDVICGGAQDNSSLARTTSDVWDLQAVTGDGFVCQINPDNQDYSYITSYPGTRPNVLRSTSGILGSYYGITGVGSGINSGESSNWVTPYLLDPTHPSVLYLGTQRVYRSTNHGSNWIPQEPSNMCGGGSLKALAINRDNPTYLFAGCESGKLWRTEDSGANWTDITAGLPGRSITDIAGDPSNPDRAFAVVGGFNTAHLWEWNEGSGWVARGLDLPNVPANTVLFVSTNDMFVGMDTGVFRSQDGGVTFEPWMAGMPEGLVVTDLKLLPEQALLTAGTYGRGAWQVLVDPTASDVRYSSMGITIELDGDGDFNFEPGETWAIRPMLRNVGGQAATELTARLTSSTPGVTVFNPEGEFGNLQPGDSASPSSAFEVAFAPDFPCGEDAVFDLVEIRSTDDPGIHSDVMEAFSVKVIHGYLGPLVSKPVLEHDFGDDSDTDWTVQFGSQEQTGSTAGTDGGWKRVSDGTEQGGFFRVDDSSGDGETWLHLGGTESAGGSGIEIPREMLKVRLVLEHSYYTRAARGRVVIDAEADGRDDYRALIPDGKRPAEKNGFRGASGGTVISTYDLTRYRGRTVHLAFVYESNQAGDESEPAANGNTQDGDVDLGGWTIDGVSVEVLSEGTPICDVSQWPGSVPATVLFSLNGSEIEATWADSCNALEFPGQTYSIQAGDLDALAAGGGYSHAPVDDLCGMTSPASFTPGSANEYYLVTPNGEGREGGQGLDTDNGARPQVTETCGRRRVAECF